jgi:hypothetical protein
MSMALAGMQGIGSLAGGFGGLATGLWGNRGLWGDNSSIRYKTNIKLWE